jgi:hypothetical protein
MKIHTQVTRIQFEYWQFIVIILPANGFALTWEQGFISSCWDFSILERQQQHPYMSPQHQMHK